MTNENDNNSNPNNNSDNSGSDSNNSGVVDKKPLQTVPLSDYLEQKKAAKALKEELAGYREKETKEKDAKLLEEKKYQELIQNKDKELGDTKNALNQTIKEHKLEKLTNKLARVLDKNNAIDAEDALKFINVDDLLDADKVDDEINKRVTELAKNKSYLFNGKQGTTRSSTENGQPSGNSGQGVDGGGNKGKIDPIILSLANKLKQS